MMENGTTPGGVEAQNNSQEFHICPGAAQSLIRHFTTHCKNLKAEVRELNTKDLLDFVTNEVAQSK